MLFFDELPNTQFFHSRQKLFETQILFQVARGSRRRLVSSEKAEGDEREQRGGAVHGSVVAATGKVQNPRARNHVVSVQASTEETAVGSRGQQVGGKFYFC